MISLRPILAATGTAAIGAFLASLALAAAGAPAGLFLVVGLVFTTAATTRGLGIGSAKREVRMPPAATAAELRLPERGREGIPHSIFHDQVAVAVKRLERVRVLSEVLEDDALLGSEDAAALQAVLLAADFNPATGLDIDLDSVQVRPFARALAVAAAYRLATPHLDRYRGKFLADIAPMRPRAAFAWSLNLWLRAGGHWDEADVAREAPRLDRTTTAEDDVIWTTGGGRSHDRTGSHPHKEADRLREDARAWLVTPAETSTAPVLRPSRPLSPSPAGPTPRSRASRRRKLYQRCLAALYMVAEVALRTRETAIAIGSSARHRLALLADTCAPSRARDAKQMRSEREPPRGPEDPSNGTS